MSVVSPYHGHPQSQWVCMLCRGTDGDIRHYESETRLTAAERVDSSIAARPEAMKDGLSEIEF